MLHEASTTVNVPAKADTVAGAVYAAFTTSIAEAFPGIQCERHGNEVRYSGLQLTVGEGANQVTLNLSGRVAALDLQNGTAVLTSTSGVDLSGHPDEKLALVVSYVGQISVSDAVNFEHLALHAVNSETPLPGMVHEAGSTVGLPFPADAVITTIIDEFTASAGRAPTLRAERRGNEIHFTGLQVTVGEGAERLDLKLSGRIVAQDVEGGSVLTATEAIDAGGFTEEQIPAVSTYIAQFALGDAIRFEQLVHHRLNGRAVS